jgi:hypothetical protein
MPPTDDSKVDSTTKAMQHRPATSPHCIGYSKIKDEVSILASPGFALPAHKRTECVGAPAIARRQDAGAKALVDFQVAEIE